MKASYHLTHFELCEGKPARLWEDPRGAVRSEARKKARTRDKPVRLIEDSPCEALTPYPEGRWMVGLVQRQNGRAKKPAPPAHRGAPRSGRAQLEIPSALRDKPVRLWEDPCGALRSAARKAA